MLIIISPSKTQEIGKAHRKDYSIPPFLDKCQKIVKDLQQFSVEELGETMSMSRKLSEMTQLRLADFDFPPSRQKCSQALLTFQGDVYSAITAENYTTDDLNFAQNHLRILSGLYGILHPLDLIQPHRLEMGSKFKPEPDVNLYQFWREDVTASVNETLSTMKDPILLNLASNEYTKVIDKKKLQAPIVNVSFKERQNGKLRTIAIYAKRARGAMVDFIIKNRFKKLSDLYSFNYDSYMFDKQSSTGTELLFTR
jgi:cytoplasmic iron level regulating protein YaaA (DUF328/UPF0246 family)